MNLIEPKGLYPQINFLFGLVQTNYNERLWQSLVKIMGLGGVEKGYYEKSLSKNLEYSKVSFNAEEMKFTPQVIQQIKKRSEGRIFA